MIINHAFQLNAPADEVYSKLMDPNILQASIPGCHSVKKLGDKDFEVVLALKLAGRRVHFVGKVSVEELVPGRSFNANGTVQVAGYGFSAAVASIHLREIKTGIQTGGTQIDASVRMSKLGKIAFFGEPLIRRKILNFAIEFFRRFGASIAHRPMHLSPKA